ncbi:YjeF protein, function unknown [Lachnospiraceae bacterium TWA4]|nr:YjeF protein, function unknown [Lachnospiraceae bacterium TWA4]
MRAVVNASQMKEIDRYTIEEIGIPSMVLMESAARSVAYAVKEKASKEDKIVSICGVGNNGADGIAAARILKNWGYNASVVVIGSELKATNEWLNQKKIAKNLDVEFTTDFSDADSINADIVIDAIFGIGLSRKITGTYLEVIQTVNKSNAYVISVDIASGVSASDGQILNDAIKADETITFGYEKVGMLVYPGIEYSGNVKVCDIGFAPIRKSSIYAIEDSDIKISRSQNSYKGTFGKVLVVAGSEGMAGAALFSAKAAYKMGCGLVKVYTPKENRIIIQSKLPEALLATYEQAIEKELEWADVVVLGPGLGKSAKAIELTKKVVEKCQNPLVIDADALRILAHLNIKLNSNMILTPSFR